MKLLFKIVAPVAVMVTAAGAVAMAAPLTPTTPYPDVPANADVCKVEKLDVTRAQIELDIAKRAYERAKTAYERGVGAISAMRIAEIAVHRAMIKLNAAKYAEAACRNNKGNDANKPCITLALDLNRLLDELALRQEVERLARAEYDRALEGRRTGVVSEEELDKTELEWRLAEVDRQQTEQRITDQRELIAANIACRGFPFDRRPAPPAPPQPTSALPTSPTVTTGP
jgi:hypothetical protein